MRPKRTPQEGFSLLVTFYSAESDDLSKAMAETGEINGVHNSVQRQFGRQAVFAASIVSAEIRAEGKRRGCGDRIRIAILGHAAL